MRARNYAALVATLAASGLFLAARGDEPTRLGRLFRPTTATPPTAALASEPPADLPPLTPVQPRIVPQPRVGRAVTEADPLVTRIALGRSNEGSQFGMFLMVYADGTVIDSEGVHRLGRDALKDVSAALTRTDFFRIKGHCGGPSTDFIEHVQMVVYERSLGRLRAGSFSFSGNAQGCDPAVQRLNATLDALQARLSRTGSPSPAPSANPSAPPILLNDAPAS